MIRKLLLVLFCAGSLPALAALDPVQVRQLAAEDSSDKVAAIRALVQAADPGAGTVWAEPSPFADDAADIKSLP